jgi:hypothetical protein
MLVSFLTGRFETTAFVAVAAAAAAAAALDKPLAPAPPVGAPHNS